MKAIQAWLQSPGNDRLSVGQIFQSLDVQGYGDLDRARFDGAMSRLGIKLKKPELDMLQELLVDPDTGGDMNYVKMVRHLKGVP